MSESLKDILQRRDDGQPTEIKIIKEFVQKRFQSEANVTMNKQQIVITVRGAALAGTLRLHILELQNALKTTKKLLIRVG